MISKEKKTGQLVDYLFDDFLAPLVLGGQLRPTRFVSGRAALGLSGHEPSDGARYHAFQETRLERARELLPIATVPTLDRDAWAMVACLHDLLLLHHPSFRGPSYRRLEKKVLLHVETTLQAILPPRTLADCIARHTLLARLFEVRRKDTLVRWWTGSAEYWGESPPSRLLAMPSLRRVRITKKEVRLGEIISGAASAARDARQHWFQACVEKSPFTFILSAGSFGSSSSPPPSRKDEALVWLETKEARRLLLRGLRRIGNAKDHVAALALMQERREQKSEGLNEFLAESRVEEAAYTDRNEDRNEDSREATSSLPRPP